MSEGVGFIVSLLIVIVPAIKERVEWYRTLLDIMDDCLNRVIDKWNMLESLKQSTRLNPIRQKTQL